jgi:hypothetical protein
MENTSTVRLSHILRVAIDNENGFMFGAKACCCLVKTSNEMIQYFNKMVDNPAFIRMLYSYKKKCYHVDNLLRILRLINQNLFETLRLNFFESDSFANFRSAYIKIRSQLWSNLHNYFITAPDPQTKIYWDAPVNILRADGPISKLEVACMTNENSQVKLDLKHHVKTLKLRGLSNNAINLKQLNVHNLVLKSAFRNFCVLPQYLVSLTLRIFQESFADLIPSIEFPKTLRWLAIISTATILIDQCTFPDNLEILCLGCVRKYRALKRLYAWDACMGSYIFTGKTTMCKFEGIDLVEIEPKLLPPNLKAYNGRWVTKIVSEPMKNFFEKMEYFRNNQICISVMIETKHFPNLVTLSLTGTVRNILWKSLIEVIDNFCPKLKQFSACPNMYTFGKIKKTFEPILLPKAVPEIYLCPTDSLDNFIYCIGNTVRLKCENATEIKSIYFIYWNCIEIQGTKIITENSEPIISPLATFRSNTSVGLNNYYRINFQNPVAKILLEVV